jgi:hypothetical protein
MKSKKARHADVGTGISLDQRAERSDQSHQCSSGMTLFEVFDFVFHFVFGIFD